MSPLKKIKYLALGDSYTIGESVAQQQTFPFLLAGELRRREIADVELTVIARTGWTTSELQLAIQETQLSPPYDLVTLLVGVNNQYRGQSLKQYEREFTELVDQAIAYANGKADHVMVVSIPDYGCTPFGAVSKERIAREIDLFNRVNYRVSEKKRVLYTDITPISRLASEHVEWIAEDGLHPSAAMYAQWVELLTPPIEQVLGNDSFTALREG